MAKERQVTITITGVSDLGKKVIRDMIKDGLCCDFDDNGYQLDNRKITVTTDKLD